MNTKVIDETSRARDLVAGGILWIESFDQDDMTFLDRVEAANELLHKEQDAIAAKSTILVGQFGRRAEAREEARA